MANTRVMLVEDERIVALNLKQRLVKLGYDVSALATSGEQALREIERACPDIVLMDINIEGDIDGIETAARIPAHCYAAVIYLTAYSEQATLDRAAATNPYGYLLKPFSERELHATIQMVLERRRADLLSLENERRLAALVLEGSVELKERARALQEETLRREVAEAAVRQGELEAQLRRVQRLDAIGQLTGGIAHDFNNLLTVIVGNLDQLAEPDVLAEEWTRMAENALNAALRGGELTSRLLAFARQQPLSPRPIQLNVQLPPMIELLRRTLGEAVRIETDLAADLWITEADPSQVEDAVVNLALNARDAMPRGGTLKIATRNVTFDAGDAVQNIEAEPGDYTVLEVTDTGTGMSWQAAERAIEPFFTTKEAGTGLGLSMVYGFAKQSHGHVEIHSKLGHGTTVSIYLPRSTSDRPGVSGRRTERRVVPTGGEAILVVEDDDNVRDITVRHLTGLGYRVRTADDGPAALAMLEASEAIDLLFTDIVMPGGMSGYDVADAVLARRPGTCLLFATGYAGPPPSTGPTRHASVPLLRKPFRKPDLAAAIRGALDSR